MSGGTSSSAVAAKDGVYDAVFEVVRAYSAGTFGPAAAPHRVADETQELVGLHGLKRVVSRKESWLEKQLAIGHCIGLAGKIQTALRMNGNGRANA